MSSQADTLEAFKAVVWEYYHAHGRDLPWRRPAAGGEFDPYVILVSEVMLQQTQVNRVIPKYQAFLEQFPDLKTLAKAELSEVLAAWSGLGYNRRAKYLHELAQQVMQSESATLPSSQEDLVKLPGVGKNTAGAVLAYAFNKPVFFIETNIRTAYLYHFFKDQTEVADSQLAPLIEQTIDKDDPRQWYWALMDYGSFLKSQLPNPSRASKHHTKQSKFQGSDRQIRGQILKLLIDRSYTYDQLQKQITDPRLPEILEKLQAERLISSQLGTYSLGK